MGTVEPIMSREPLTPRLMAVCYGGMIYALCVFSAFFAISHFHGSLGGTGLRTLMPSWDAGIVHIARTDLAYRTDLLSWAALQSLVVSFPCTITGICFAIALTRRLPRTVRITKLNEQRAKRHNARRALKQGFPPIGWQLRFKRDKARQRRLFRVNRPVFLAIVVAGLLHVLIAATVWFVRGLPSLTPV